MKIAVVNGLLANEKELKKILDLVVHEFDKYDLVFDYIDLSEINLNNFAGQSNVMMDQIFNKILVSDAVIFASSIHMGNITPLMQNLFNYFELNKYKSAMQNKNVLPVIIHNTNDEITAYIVMMNFFKKFNCYEVNKLFLDIPVTITDDYLDKTCKYIKVRTKEFASLLVPSSVEKVEKKEVSNVNINEILNSDDLVYDENQLTLEEITQEEKNVRELTSMVNNKLQVKAIVKEDESQKNVIEISQKYKSKIEQIMQETLFGDSDSSDEDEHEETIAEAMFKNEVSSKKEPVVNKKPTDSINFKRNVEEMKIQNEEAEDLDSLIARVVVKAKAEREATREKEAEEKAKQLMASTFSATARNAEVKMPRKSYLDFDDEDDNDNETFENLNANNEEIQNHDLQENEYVNDYSNNQIELSNQNVYDNDEDQEFVKILRKTDDDERKEADEINEIKFFKQEKQEQANVNQMPMGFDMSNKTQNFEEPKEERFEPDSIKELRKKLLDIRTQRNEIVNEVNDIKNEIETRQTYQEEVPTVSVSKFNLEGFYEPHEVVPYEEKEATKEYKEEKSMSLKDMTKNLIYLFKAPENEQMKALIQLNVEGDEGFNVYLNIVDNKCSIFDGINMSNDITIYVKDENWRTILDGEVTLQRAFMTGLVKVTGNFMMLNKLDNTLLAYNK